MSVPQWVFFTPYVRHGPASESTVRRHLRAYEAAGIDEKVSTIVNLAHRWPDLLLQLMSALRASAHRRKAALRSAAARGRRMLRQTTRAPARAERQPRADAPPERTVTPLAQPVVGENVDASSSATDSELLVWIHSEIEAERRGPTDA